MRRIISTVLALILMLSLCACGGANGESNALSKSNQNEEAVTTSETEKTDTSIQQETAAGNSVLVVWFSATGNTMAIADTIAETLQADRFEIVPKEPYSEADLDYNSDCRANREQDDDSARPEFAGEIENIGQYDVIFLGHPIWWGKLPKIMYTFLEQYDLSGKTIIPFCTSGSSKNTTSVKEIRTLQPGAEVNDGRRFAAGTDAETIREWLDELDLPMMEAGADKIRLSGGERASSLTTNGGAERASSLTTNGGAVIELSSLEHLNADADSTVYFISDITPESMVEIYNALDWTPTGKVAVKLSTGEPPASNYLRPELIADLVQLVNGTIVECNTAYGGSRASTAMHYQVAEDHGFTEIADFQIQDENGSMSIPVEGGTRLSENYVGAAFADYDSYLVLSHFKGHSMAGFGGAIKNISIGLASSEGKAWIHSGGTSRTNPWGGKQDAFCEAMADAGKSVSAYLGSGERIVYINVMNRLSIDCDCNGNPADPDMHDIGVLASTDPVALDQACIDLVWVSEGSKSFIHRVENRNGLHTLESGEAIGLGRRSYRLVPIE